MTNESGNKPVHHKKHIARQQREKQQTRLILYTFFGLLGLVVLLLFYGWLDVNYLQLNRPVAKVGETEILAKDFEARVRLQRQNFLNQYGQYLQYQQYFGMDFSAQLSEIETQLSFPELIGQTVLEQMIDEEVIRQEAAKRGITLSEEELNTRIQEAFEYFPNGTMTPTVTPTEAKLENLPFDITAATFTPDPAATAEFTATPEATATITAQPTVEGTVVDITPEASVTATLEPTATATLEPTITPTSGPTSTPFPTATPITQEGYEKIIADTVKNLGKFGLNEEYYRDYYEFQMLRERLVEAVTADAAPTEEQVHARHILVEDYDLAVELIERLKNGEDFAALAEEYSTDTGSAAQGGDLGWFGKGAMVPQFEAAAFELQNPGDFTDKPIQSDFGYHIIQLIERPYSPESFQAAKEAAFLEWLATTREEYNLEVFDLWRERVPTEPNFITAATESVAAQQTADAESVSTFEASAPTETPKP